MVLLYIYRLIFHTPEQRALREQRQEKYGRINRKLLLEGSLPIFIGALISEFIVALTEAITDGDTNNTIIISVIYAVIVAPCIGYYLMFRVSPQIVSNFLRKCCFQWIGRYNRFYSIRILFVFYSVHI